MRSSFREWYWPSDDEFNELWRDAVVVLDSNVLLDFYQYPEQTLNAFLQVLDRLGDRLWMPHQVGVEYHRNRAKSLPQPRATLETLAKAINEISSSVNRLGLPEYHPILDITAAEEKRRAAAIALDSLSEHVSAALDRTPCFDKQSVLSGDRIRDRTAELFENRVGPPFTPDQLQEVYAEADTRFERDVPPGFKDKAKDAPARYGDYLLWKQILGRDANDTSRATIFVTNDRKEDWWLRKSDTILGPRPELIREHLDTRNGMFFMYLPAGFLKEARRLDLDVSTEAIADVDRVSTQSPVAYTLRWQRMRLPNPSARVSALNALYDAVTSGNIRFVRDLNTAIAGLGEPFDSTYVRTPLFFSLINESYGPFVVPRNVPLRLNDRTIDMRPDFERKAEWVRGAHAAWLAQALYRLRRENLSEEDMLEAFFGDDYSDDALAVFRRAQKAADKDIETRGVL